MNRKPLKKGDGIFDPITDRLKAFQGPRKGATGRFQKFLNDTKDNKILSIMVARKPVVKLVQKALNVLSLGKYNQKKKDLKYDDMYHNYLLVEMDNGHIYVIEKNHVVEARKAKQADFNVEKYGIPLNGRQVNLKQLVETASKDNPDEFWGYNAKKNNCQQLVDEIISDNKFEVTDPKAKALIEPQRAGDIIDTLGPLKGLPLMTTNLAGALDRAVYGKSVRVIDNYVIKH